MELGQKWILHTADRMKEKNCSKFSDHNNIFISVINLSESEKNLQFFVSQGEVINLCISKFHTILLSLLHFTKLLFFCPGYCSFLSFVLLM